MRIEDFGERLVERKNEIARERERERNSKGKREWEKERVKKGLWREENGENRDVVTEVVIEFKCFFQNSGHSESRF